MSHKFKVGDIVECNYFTEVIDTAHTRIRKDHRVEIGKIVVARSSDYLIEFNNNVGNAKNSYPHLGEIKGSDRECYWHVSDFNIRLARIKNSKLARKLYPNYKVEGKWLIAC